MLRAWAVSAAANAGRPTGWKPQREHEEEVRRGDRVEHQSVEHLRRTARPVGVVGEDGQDGADDGERESRPATCEPRNGASVVTSRTTVVAAAIRTGRSQRGSRVGWVGCADVRRFVVAWRRNGRATVAAAKAAQPAPNARPAPRRALAP